MYIPNKQLYSTLEIMAIQVYISICDIILGKEAGSDVRM